MSETISISINSITENENMEEEEQDIAVLNEYPENEVIMADENEKPEKDISDTNKNNMNHIGETSTCIIKDNNIYIPKETIIFNPWYKHYNSHEIYSQQCIFGLKYEQKKSIDLPFYIRKKIRKHFFKDLAKFINNKLIYQENEEINIKFNWPQCIKISIAKELNINIMEKTLKEMILDNSLIKNNIKENDIIYYENNKIVYNYLENKYKNEKNYGDAMKMKMKDIFKEYLISDEFQQYIEKLRKKGKYNFEYVKNNLIIANNFIEFFSPYH